jgi:hypothetical protein
MHKAILLLILLVSLETGSTGKVVLDGIVTHGGMMRHDCRDIDGRGRISRNIQRQRCNRIDLRGGGELEDGLADPDAYYKVGVIWDRERKGRKKNLSVCTKIVRHCVMISQPDCSCPIQGANQVLRRSTTFTQVLESPPRKTMLAWF